MSNPIEEKMEEIIKSCLRGMYHGDTDLLTFDYMLDRNTVIIMNELRGKLDVREKG